MAEDQMPTSGRPLTRRELREMERASAERESSASADEPIETLFLTLADVENAEADVENDEADAATAEADLETAQAEPQASEAETEHEQPQYASRRDLRRAQHEQDAQDRDQAEDPFGTQPEESIEDLTRQAIATPVDSELEGTFDDEAALEEYELQRVEKLRDALGDADIDAMPSFNDVLGISTDDQRDAQRKLETTGVIGPVTRNIEIVVPETSPSDVEETQEPPVAATPATEGYEPRDPEQDGGPVSASTAHGLEPMTYQEGGARQRLIAMGVVGGSAVIAVAAALFALLSR